MSKVTNKQLAETVLSQLTAGKTRAQVVEMLAAYVVHERRTKDTESVVRAISDLLQTQKGHVELDVTTVHALGVETADMIKTMFSSEGKEVIINHKTDSSVIGGVLVEAPGKRLDLTVRRRLQRLRETGVK